MAILQIAQLIHTAYANRSKIKRAAFWIIAVAAVFLFFLYLIIATAFAVIQGTGNVTDTQIDDSDIPFTEFVNFRYKTIRGELWYDYNQPYYFPTLGRLTQGVILDSSAQVGLRHVAWDIADRTNRKTEVKSFSEGTITAVNSNILYNTTRRWRFCDSPSGICWYEVTERADVQYACGFEVIIQHPDSLKTQYCHLAAEPHYNTGDPVEGGQNIGYQGATGWATGKHLHFALWRDGQPIDPSYAFTQTSLSDWNQ